MIKGFLPALGAGRAARLGLVWVRPGEDRFLEPPHLTSLFVAFLDPYALHILKLGASHIGAAVFDSGKIR